MKYSQPIELSHNRMNLLKLLTLGITPESSPYSHKQIVEWCEAFLKKYDNISASKEIGSLMPILADIEAQWDLYLINTYSLKELQDLNFDAINLPLKFFSSWLAKIK